MDLKDAIQRVAKFCPRTKSAMETLKAVRFFAASKSAPARLFATGGPVGILVDLDVDVPDAVLPADPLVKMVRSAQLVQSMTQEESGAFRFEVYSKDHGDPNHYTINGTPPAEFPGPPVLPHLGDYEVLEGWEEIARVLHAVGDDPMKPELQLVHFGEGYVEATDLHRAVRVDSTQRWRGLVPGEAFKNWPLKSPEVRAFFSEHYAYFRVGEEVRYGALQPPGRFHGPKLDSYFQPWAETRPFVTLNPVALLDTVKRALDVSPWKTVSLAFGLTGITVRAYVQDGGPTGFESSVPASITPLMKDGCMRPVEVLCNAGYLVEALKEVDTPRVRVVYEAPDRPLRLESGSYVTCLWPSPAPELK